MPNPYTPPQSTIHDAPDTRPTATRLAKVGAWMQLGPVIGLIGTTVGMVHAFSTLSTDGVGDPSKLSAAIGEVLIATALGFMVGLIGSVFLGIAIFGQRCRAFWVRIMFGLSLLPLLLPASQMLMRMIGKE